jgi:hypothetical protein
MDKIYIESFRQIRFLNLAVLYLNIFSLAFLANETLAKQAPTIRLFPTTVVENIKQTGQAAKAMEQDLQSVIERLNQQEALFTASKCEGAGAEPGCSDIAGQLSQTYMEPTPVLKNESARNWGAKQPLAACRKCLKRRLKSRVNPPATSGIQEN